MNRNFIVDLTAAVKNPSPFAKIGEGLDIQASSDNDKAGVPDSRRREAGTCCASPRKSMAKTKLNVSSPYPNRTENAKQLRLCAIPNKLLSERKCGCGPCPDRRRAGFAIL
jgi:hypothetical protein